MSDETGGPGRASGPVAGGGVPARPKRRKSGRTPQRKPAPKPAPRAKPRRVAHVEAGPTAWTITVPDASLRIVPPFTTVTAPPGTPASNVAEPRHDPLVALSDENLERALSALVPPAATVEAGADDRTARALLPTLADGAPVSADAAAEEPAPLAGPDRSAPAVTDSIPRAEPGRPAIRSRLVAAAGTAVVLLALGWASAGLLRGPSGDAAVPSREPATTAALPSAGAGLALPLVVVRTLPPDDAAGPLPVPVGSILGAEALASASVLGPSPRENVLAKDATREQAKADPTARAAVQKKPQPKAAMAKPAPAAGVSPAEETSFRPGRAILDFLSSAMSP